MEHFICGTCGVQFPASEQPPEHCPICEDERQYIGWQGQGWTTLTELRQKLSAVIREEEPNLIGFGMEPAFGINQRALLVRTPHGNVLWDCMSLINDEIIAKINELGGIVAIAMSHPHYYSTIVEWSHAFGNVPIYIHEADREHVVRPDPVIRFWEGTTHELLPGLTIINTPGHFDGASVLHWADSADGKGVLLAGDIIYVVSDRRYASFMRSYPNLIPLNASQVRQIVSRVEPYQYDRIYTAWFDRTMSQDAKAAVQRSAERYIAAISE